MKVNQGLLNWLNAVNHVEKNYGQTEKVLLLAPIDSVQQNNHETEILIHEINEPVHYENQETEYEFELEHKLERKIESELESKPEHEFESEHKPEPEIKSESEARPEHKFELEHEQTEQEFESEREIKFESESEHEYKLESESEQIERKNESEHEHRLEAESEQTEREFELELEQAEREFESEHDSEQEQPQHNESQNESQELNTLIGIPDDIVRNSAIKEAEAITQELQLLKNEVDSIRETTHGLDLNKAWHEANAGIELSMNEPPPQLWASQNESESEDEENENDSEDYEHIILQQNSSVTIHGTNFTQRLQRTLQGRKNKAAELKRKSTEKQKHSHSYILHAFLMCSVMLLALGLAWLSLRYIQTKTPNSLNQRASELYEQGKYDEAMNLYQEAYNRYPNDIRFLEGIARSAEKAGHSQTANIAWNEYRNSNHENQSRDIEPQKEPVEITHPLKINVNTKTGGGKKESKEESKIEAKTEAREPVRILTFDDYLNEANRLYNIRMYTRALVNFMKALELRNDDIRPYIGLAESYRAKGIDFEAKRILNEAERRFGRNPTIETLKKLLKGSK